MGTRYLLGDLVTGGRIVNLPVLKGSQSDDLDTAESISVTVKMNNDVVRTLDLSNAATVAKTYLAAVDTGAFGQYGKVLGAGPVWNTSYDRSAGTLEITAKGMYSIFDHRFVLPPIAATVPVDQWTVPDPADTTGVGTIPNPVVASTWSNMSLGSIAVSAVAQSMSWPGGALPIILPDIEHDTDPEHTRTVQGADFKTVGSFLDDLINVIGGPEINFMPRFTADNLAMEWVMQVGTNEEPLLYSQTVMAWNVTAKDSPVKSLTIDVDGSGMGSISWATGGRQSDTVLVSRVTSSTLTDAGYPLMEVVDSTHSDVVKQSTLDGYAAGNLTAATRPSETWQFSVKAHPVDKNGNAAGPQIDDYDVGDFIKLHIDPYNDENDRGDLYLPGGGDIALRIVGLSGDEKGEDVQIQCAPVVG
jgi:hypothetical protein